MELDLGVYVFHFRSMGAPNLRLLYLPSLNGVLWGHPSFFDHFLLGPRIGQVRIRNGMLHQEKGSFLTSRVFGYDKHHEHLPVTR